MNLFCSEIKNYQLQRKNKNNLFKSKFISLFYNINIKRKMLIKALQ